ncbi:hypothetical protein EV192_104201 [Actinocrispum wychmicini]|uniref:Uncharacterized protein n=1 Tax=Actinocrispum wychmicini TaxID=1213861 RepID=A0A4V2S7C4_9PSEU|nr:hypothetical protein EV192_104201 [Actinocrispum wychmicini]
MRRRITQISVTAQAERDEDTSPNSATWEMIVTDICAVLH